MNVMEVPQWTGTGIIWDVEGHIITNYHVVRDTECAEVAIISGDANTVKSSRRGTALQYKRNIYEAKIVGIDPDKDIAVLKIDGPKSALQPIFIGTSSSLRVGQQALA